MKETRNTIQRGLVLDALRQLGDHPTASEIYQFIAQNHPTISRGTVYRNLNMLADRGEIRRVGVSDAADRFDDTICGHYHVRCTRCGRVGDVAMPFLDDLEGRITDAHGYRIEGHDIVFKGVCPICLHNSGDGG